MEEEDDDFSLLIPPPMESRPRPRVFDLARVKANGTTAKEKLGFHSKPNTPCTRAQVPLAEYVRYKIGIFLCSIV